MSNHSCKLVSAALNGISQVAVRSDLTTDCWVHSKSLVEVFFSINGVGYREQVIKTSLTESIHCVLNIDRIVLNVSYINGLGVFISTGSVELSLHVISCSINTTVNDRDSGGCIIPIVSGPGTITSTLHGRKRSWIRVVIGTIIRVSIVVWVGAVVGVAVVIRVSAVVRSSIVIRSGIVVRVVVGLGIIVRLSIVIRVSAVIGVSVVFGLSVVIRISVITWLSIAIFSPGKVTIHTGRLVVRAPSVLRVWIASKLLTLISGAVASTPAHSSNPLSAFRFTTCELPSILTIHTARIIRRTPASVWPLSALVSTTPSSCTVTCMPAHTALPFRARITRAIIGRARLTSLCPSIGTVPHSRII
mmetsp:Transcript_69267/g.96057  ORF Transcript_69267/g.96057 Transcript_69267/m.96057 type:complete len:360 (-) Transcript_69267:201-1280(-)